MIISGFLKKEIVQIFRNPPMVFALLVMPVVQVFLFSYAITNEPKNITIAIESAPNDYLLNRVYEHTLASKWFVKVTSSNKEAFELVKSDTAAVVLRAPTGGLTRGILKGVEQPTLQILIDATNVLKAQAVSGYLNSIIISVLAKEMPQQLASDKLRNINFTPRILFNPELNTKFFIVPAIMSMVVTSSILSLICLAIAKEKESGTMETLISSPITKYHLIIGKTLPFILIALFNLIVILTLGVLFFRVPVRGSLWMIFASFAVFSFAMSALGVFVATFCQTQQQALLAVMMVLFLQMMTSGTMFPTETMPWALQLTANVNPLSHFIFLFRNIMLKGGDLSYFFYHLAYLASFGAVFSYLGLKRLKQTF